MEATMADGTKNLAEMTAEEIKLMDDDELEAALAEEGVSFDDLLRDQSKQFNKTFPLKQ